MTAVGMPTQVRAFHHFARMSRLESRASWRILRCRGGVNTAIAIMEDRLARPPSHGHNQKSAVFGGIIGCVPQLRQLHRVPLRRREGHRRGAAHGLRVPLRVRGAPLAAARRPLTGARTSLSCLIPCIRGLLETMFFKLYIALLPFIKLCIRAAHVELVCTTRAHLYRRVRVCCYRGVSVLIRVAGCTATRS